MITVTTNDSIQSIYDHVLAEAARIRKIDVEDRSVIESGTLWSCEEVEIKLRQVAQHLNINLEGS